MGEMPKCSGLLTFDELVAEVVDNVLKEIFTERFAFFVWTYLETGVLLSA